MIKDSALVFFGKILATLCAIAIDAMLSRSLSVDDLGRWFIFSKVVMIFAILITMGSPNLLIKDVNVYSEHVSQRLYSVSSVVLGYVKFISFVGILFSTTLFVILYGGLLDNFLGAEGVPVVFFGVAVWAFLRGLQPLTSAIFRATKSYALSAMFGPTVPAIFTSISLFIITSYREINLPDVVFISGFSILTSILICGFLFSVFNVEDSGNENFSRSVFAFMALGFPVMLSQFSQGLIQKFDVLLCSSMFGLEKTAIYGVASKLILVVSFFFVIRDSVLSSRLAKLISNNNWVGLDKILVRSSYLIGYPCMIILCIFYFFAEEIITIVYGYDYIVSTDVFRALIVGSLVAVFCGPSTIVMIMLGEQKLMMKISFASLILSVALIISFASGYGFVGMVRGVALSIAITPVLLAGYLILVKNVWVLTMPRLKALK